MKPLYLLMMLALAFVWSCDDGGLNHIVQPNPPEEEPEEEEPLEYPAYPIAVGKEIPLFGTLSHRNSDEPNDIGIAQSNWVTCVTVTNVNDNKAEAETEVEAYTEIVSNQELAEPVVASPMWTGFLGFPLAPDGAVADGGVKRKIDGLVTYRTWQAPRPGDGFDWTLIPFFDPRRECPDDPLLGRPGPRDPCSASTFQPSPWDRFVLSFSEYFAPFPERIEDWRLEFTEATDLVPATYKLEVAFREPIAVGPVQGDNVCHVVKLWYKEDGFLNTADEWITNSAACSLNSQPTSEHLAAHIDRSQGGQSCTFPSVEEIQEWVEENEEEEE